MGASLNKLVIPTAFKFKNIVEEGARKMQELEDRIKLKNVTL